MTGSRFDLAYIELTLYYYPKKPPIFIDMGGISLSLTASAYFKFALKNSAIFSKR